MKWMILALLAVAPTTALAQSVAPVPARARDGALPEDVDPARVVAARPIVEKIWPLGTYKRLMSGTMDKMMDAMMGSMFGMKAGDLVGPMAGEKEGEVKSVLGDATMGDMASAADPHFAERMKITTRVMFDEMGTLMAKFEPDVQDAVGYGLARRFTVDELGELDRFFSTPVGRRYAADSMLLAAEPEMVGAMAKFLPDFMQAMPGIMKKVEAATAHLPPPPKPPGEAEETSPPSIKS